MKILVVVDMQNDFITGTLGSKEAQAIVPNVVKKITECIDNNYYIAFTYDTHDKNYLNTLEGKKLPVEHCIQGTEGWLLDSNIAKTMEKIDILFHIHPIISIICKKTFGSFSLVNDIVQVSQRTEIESIEIVGLCTDICVIANTILLKTRFSELPIIVDAACCAGSTPEAHKKALELMRDSLQIDIVNMEK